jgi:hypothetical protein
MPDILKSDNLVTRRNRDMTDGTFAQIVATAQQTLFRTTFAKVLASGVDPDYFIQIGALGTGITYSQTGGNLVINSGTTINSELILRSTVSWRDMLELKYQAILSQRIVNNSFTVELVDVIGDNLQYVINSAVSVTVTIPGNLFSAANVGQSMNLGAIAGAAGVAGRYAIASVSGPAVTFTVAGWPATGNGTLSVFGFNFHRVEYSGVTATAANYDTQRKGWNSGFTAATINTTAAPGHMGIVTSEDGMGAFLDQLVASSTALQTAMRASRVVNIPDENAPLFLQIRVQNGTVAPASTTAWTIGMAAVSDYMAQNVAINSIRPQAFNSALPVAVQSGTLTTVATVTNVTTAGTPLAPATPFFLNSAATTNSTLVLTGTSGLQALWATNIGATVAFVKLYNKATAPTVGTDVPEMIITVPAAVAGVPGTIEVTPGFNGYRFALGLGLAITGAVADADTTAVAAGQVKVKLSRTV